MKNILFYLFVFFTHLTLFGNPILVLEHGTMYDAKKLSESCIVSVDKEKSFVSCYVEYGLTAKNIADETIKSYYLGVSLPIFVDKYKKYTENELIETFNPIVEIAGRAYTPDRTSNRFEESTNHKIPPGTNLIYFRFMIEVGIFNEKNYDVLVSYQQPTILGHFYYIPLFESKAPKSRHTMDIFPSRNTINVSPEGITHDWIKFNRRVRTNLEDSKLIKVKIEER